MKISLMLFKLFLVTTVSLFAFSPNLSWAADYYVKQAGNDSLSGTSDASAWRTFTNINTHWFVPGDRILLKRGNSWNQTLTPSGNGLSGNKITIDAYGNSGGLPIIWGSNDTSFDCIKLYDQSYWSIRNIDFFYALHGVYAVNSPDTHTDGIDVIGCTFRNMQHLSQYPQAFGTGIVLAKQGYYHDIYIADCTFDSCCQSIGLNYTSDFLIEDCESYGGKDGGFTFEYCDAGTIRDSYIHDMGQNVWNGSCGIYFGNCSSISVESTYVHNIKNGGGADGCAIDFEHNNYYIGINNCNLAGCDGPGISWWSSILGQPSTQVYVYGSTYIAYNNQNLSSSAVPYNIAGSMFGDWAYFDNCYLYLGNSASYWNGVGNFTFNNCHYY